MQIEGDWGFRLRNAPRRGLARIRRTSGFFMSAVVNFSSTLNEPAGVVSLASQGWGVVKSLELIGSGPVGLVHTQKIEAQSEKPTWTKALEFTQFACPCWTDPRLLSGEQRSAAFRFSTALKRAAGNGIFGCGDRAPKTVGKTRERPQRPKSGK